MFRKSLMALAVGVVGISAQAAEQDNTSIEEVHVEGKYLSSDRANSLKSPTPIIDVPQSLSIVTADQMLKQGFSSIGEIINYTPGVNTSQGEGHRDSVVFRGVRSTADFYLDGVRDDVQYYRPLYNLEQVEILRGPNALLFGRGGTGGILNRVTKKSVIGEDFTGYKASVDSFGEHGVQLDSNTTLSDSAAFRINLMYEGLENHRDFYDGDRYGVNPTLKLQLSEDTVLDLSYEYVDHDRFIDRGIPTGADGRPVDRLDDVVFGDPKLNKTELEAHLFRAALQHTFSESLKANVNVFYGDYDKLYQNFYASSYNEATPDQVTIDGYVDTTERQNLILSANLVNEFDFAGFNHTLIAGVEYIDTSSDQDRYNAVWTPDGNADSDTEIFTIGSRVSLSNGVGVNAAGTTVTNSFSTDLNDDSKVDIEVMSLYIQDEIEVSENLDVVLGARFDSFDIDVVDVKGGGARDDRSDTEVSPRFGVIYKHQENISIYASYSQTFLPSGGEQFANLGDDLSPDEFESAEIGLKWDFAQGLSLTVAYFENEEDRKARDDSGELFEGRGLEVEGFEVQLDGQITDRLSIRGGYSYQDGETIDEDTRETGLEPRELPEHMASLWGSYQATENLGLGLGVIYQDESLINDGGDRTLPSYTRVDLAAYYDVSPKLRVQLNIENLFDEEYYPNAHSSHQATVGAPVNATVSISGRF